MRVTRRQVLANALGGSCALALGGTTSDVWAHQSAAGLSTSVLAEGLVVIAGAGANVVAARTPEGVLQIDGGLEQNSAQLRRYVLREMSARRVHTLFNTHWHPEQTGSNERLGRDGAQIIAHENTKLWLARKISVAWREGTYGPLPPKALPRQTFYTTARLTAGSETVEYGVLPQAHTEGDIYVHFPNANVLAGGGVVSADRWPVLDWQTGGWIGGLVAGLDALIQLANDATRIVPANGPVMTRAELQTQRAMYFRIYERVVAALNKGLSAQEMLELSPSTDLNPAWGDASPFLTMAFKSLWGHFAPNG